MSRVHAVSALVLLGLLGCEEPEKGTTELQYRITPDNVDLGSIRYDQDDPPSATITVLNLDTRTLRVTAEDLSGTGSGMIVLKAENFDEVEPDETANLELAVTDDVLLWDEGAQSADLTISVGYYPADTGAAEEPIEDAVVVPITVTMDCDLDDDGAEADTTGGPDCDDALSGVGPEATELCDGLDNDCDGLEDEDDAADALIWYRDGDEDDYGSAETTTTACEEPDGFVGNGSDCDDGNAEIYPGQTEECNGVDDDCDEAVDEDPECLTEG